MTSPSRWEDRLWLATGEHLSRHSTWVILGTILITLLLLLPIFLLAPESRASDDPGGEVFEVAERIGEDLPVATHTTFFILEARDGDLLKREVLLELQANQEALLGSGLVPYLSSGFDTSAGRPVAGIWTLSDMVELYLGNAFGIELGNASADQIDFAANLALSDPNNSGIMRSLSVKSTHETQVVLGQEIEVWTIPAIVFPIHSENRAILDDYSLGLDGDNDDTIVKEYYDRELQEILRGDQQTYRLYGIAIDIGLEGEEEGAFSVPLIGLAILLIIVIVSIQFRSFKLTALTFLGVVMLIIWLKGFSNLIGLSSSLILDIIVPVAILVLGVDYLIHSMHRYHEELDHGHQHRRAFALSVAGVSGALVLALATTVFAFLSNLTSQIQTIFEFGIGSAIAIIAAFWIMGYFVPTVKMRWDSWEQRRRGDQDQQLPSRPGPGPIARWLGRSVRRLARQRKVVIPLVVVLTLLSGWYAIQLEAKLEAKEFFDPASDFVTSLDQLELHIGPRSGEPAIIYIEGDLADPATLQVIKAFIVALADNEHIGRDIETGEANIEAPLFEMLEDVLATPYAITSIAAATGTNLTDADGDGIPDDPAQLRAVFGYIHTNGIPLNASVLLYTPQQVQELLNAEGSTYSTIIITRVPGTVEQAVVRASRNEILADMEVLEVSAIDRVGLTGSAYEREVTLSAITESLNLSILVAIALCLIVLMVMLRSISYAVITIIPEILVATWLYAFMFLAGFHLNMVTAIIAAISIGVGIDYSVHVTARFRQELKIDGDAEAALERAATTSGAALLGSAASTAIGFAVIGLAPMPMFSSFGYLTAIMIVMALTASLVVLPSLLLMVAPKRQEAG